MTLRSINLNILLCFYTYKCFSFPISIKTSLASQNPTTRAPIYCSRLNISLLMDFARDCQLDYTFLSICFLYIWLSADKFLCDQNKILQVLYFFQSGRAAKQLEGLFREKQNTEFFPITSWSEFKQCFKNQLFPINTTAKAVNKLKEILYYQESQAVKDYLDEFQKLISKTSYTNL